MDRRHPTPQASKSRSINKSEHNARETRRVWAGMQCTVPKIGTTRGQESLSKPASELVLFPGRQTCRRGPNRGFIGISLGSEYLKIMRRGNAIPHMATRGSRAPARDSYYLRQGWGLVNKPLGTES